MLEEFVSKDMKTFLSTFLCILAFNLSAQDIPYGYNDDAGAYFRVDEHTRLYYEVYGSGAPLIMLHGGVYGYIDEFGGLIPKLAEHFQVICLGSRGHVKSDIGKAPYTYEQRAKDAHKLMKHLGLEKATVLGFSDGGFGAYVMAAMYPEKVEKVVAMGAGDDPVKDSDPGYTYTAKELMAQYPDYFKKRVDHMPEPERWDESLKMLSELYNHSKVSKEVFVKIKCPVLVMSGDADEYSSPERVLAAHSYIPKSQLSLIPGCGHVILGCNLPAVWASMKPFLGVGQ